MTSKVQTIAITEEDGDQRLDRWLRKRFPYLTQGRIEKLCRKGELRVDGGRVKSATRLEVGQKVRIPPLGEEADQPAPKFNKKITRSDVEMIQSCVLWKDEHIIVLNKPPGLPSQGGSGQGDRHVDGLTEALMFGYKDRPKLVHRLDKDTSGLLLLALIWTLVFFVVLPLRLETQGEAGEIVHGTHASSPANFDIKRKVKITSLWAVPIWAVIAGVILSGAITVRDIDWFERMSTPEVSRD